MEMLANKQAKAVGLYGETWAAAALENAGYIVRAPDGTKRGDLAVVNVSTGESIRVEIKTARRGSDGTYRFCLERAIGARVCTSAQHSDFAIWERWMKCKVCGLEYRYDRVWSE
jgi:hypothetical protein